MCSRIGKKKKKRHEISEGFCCVFRHCFLLQDFEVRFFFSFPMLESLETLSPILLVSFLLQSDICIERVGVIRVKTWINF